MPSASAIRTGDDTGTSARRHRSSTVIDLNGTAFDGRSGIKDVSISSDGGKIWKDRRDARSDLGRFLFREWKTQTTLAAGDRELKVRATANDLNRWSHFGIRLVTFETS
jgi:hypothetical protein